MRVPCRLARAAELRLGKREVSRPRAEAALLSALGGRWLDGLLGVAGQGAQAEWVRGFLVTSRVGESPALGDALPARLADCPLLEEVRLGDAAKRLAPGLARHAGSGGDLLAWLGGRPGLRTVALFGHGGELLLGPERETVARE